MGDWNPEANAIFEKVLELNSRDEIDTFLAQACDGRPELREQVETLVRSHNDPESLADFVPDGLMSTVGTHDDSSTESDTDVKLDFLTPSKGIDCLGTLGKYEVLETLGRGGMGVVLRARDPRLDRVVAIKVLATHLAAMATARKRFLREARAAAAVNHDNVVTIHAVEDDQELPFLVMECVEGRTLQQKPTQRGRSNCVRYCELGCKLPQGCPPPTAKA